MKGKTKKKLKNIKALKKEAWRLISIHVRSSKANFQGYTECFTCHRMFDWRSMDCSHFYHNKLDYCEDNLRPCCVRCNRYLHGNLGEYALRLVHDLGSERVAELKIEATRKGNDYSREELNEIISRYRLSE